MLRMGMLGNFPMTFDEIGQQLGGLSRERVRQIIDKTERISKQRSHQKKLTPLITKAVEIVKAQGGKVKNTTLIEILRRAQGKTKAEVYDFIVVPEPPSNFDKELGKSLLRREMPSCIENLRMAA